MKIVQVDINGNVTERELTEEELLDFEEPLEDIVNGIRARRNLLLRESDIYVLPDRWDSYTTAKKNAWKNYRQALRDLPETTVDPKNPVWPKKPE